MCPRGERGAKLRAHARAAPAGSPGGQKTIPAGLEYPEENLTRFLTCLTIFPKVFPLAADKLG